MKRLFQQSFSKSRGEGDRSSRRAGTGGTTSSTFIGAFTVLELLIVIAIIGLLMALTLPNLGGMRKSNIMASANRQLLDDLALARHRAISGRATVYVIFVPPADWIDPTAARLSPVQEEQVLRGQFNSYMMFSRRQIGEQPGRENPRFLSPLKSLPDGIFFQVDKFNPLATGRFETNLFPFPTVTNESSLLPYIAFDFQGRLITTRGEERIPLARGSVFLERNPAAPAVLLWVPADVRESPPFNSVVNSNHIVIEGLTGRATVVRPEIP
jgi:type II secretory pathway pseudopilin PulG